MDSTAAKTRAPRRRAAALVCIIALAAAAAVTLHDWRAPVRPASLQSTAALFGRSASGPASFADTVDAVKPAVIGVQTKRSESSEEQSGSPADRFFRDFGAPPPDIPNGRQPPRTVTTQGSGFFISADGYAVTNNHVIEGSETAKIQTDDQKTYTAKVVGSDPISDLALLKVDGRSDFAFVKLADEMPRVGDWVLAVGNPFGLASATSGALLPTAFCRSTPRSTKATPVVRRSISAAEWSASI
jgi:serine protease Do